MPASRLHHGSLRAAAFCILVGLLTGVRAPGQTGHKQVLVLYDEDKTLPGLAVLDQTFRSSVSVEQDTDIVFFTESMNVSQFSDEHYDEVLRDYYQKKYRDKKLDVIVGVMGPALHFLVRNGDTIFPGVPIVFCGADAADIEGMTLPAHITGLIVQRAYTPTLDVVLRLQPATRNVFVVGGTSPFDQHLLEQARHEFQAFEQRVSFNYLTERSVDDILTSVARLPPQSVILFVSLFRDGTGRAYVTHDVVSWISSRANAPVYIFTDQYLGRGAVGGHLYSVTQLGKLTAELVSRILRGESPRTIPVRAPESRANMFDARQLVRWNLDERLLPANSIVSFREPSVWDRYKKYIILGAALLAAQFLLIAGLLVQRARRRRAEAELRSSYERIRNLSGRLLTAQETERAYFARELHDDISQQMVALQFDLQRVKEHLGVEDFQENDSLIAEASTRAATVTKNLRYLSHRMHPAHLRLIGLTGALRELQKEFSTSNLPIDFSHENVPDPLSQEIIVCFYRVAQEAMSNAVKHSGADKVSVHVLGSPHGITMTIDDNGVGFDLGDTQHGLGLLSMRERVEQIGGSLLLRSDPGKGTRLEINVPYVHEETFEADAL